jgi:hypothetical protein
MANPPNGGSEIEQRKEGSNMRKILGVVVAAFVAVLTVGAVAASAAGTAKYTFTGQSGPDSSTCGGNWANDTFTRVFTVYTDQNLDGSYRLVENFNKGHFATLQGPSPESCQAVTSNTVSANVSGAFNGSEIIKVVSGTYSAAGAAAWDGTGGTDGFITAAFGNTASNGNTLDFYFKYTTNNSAACASRWTNAATGNGGDIATFCSP